MDTWEVSSTPLVSIGVVGGEDPYQLDRVTSVARLPDGRIVVANNGSGEVRFFTPAGAFIASVGRAGGGPGEYRILDRVRMLGGDTLVVLDTYQRRSSFLDSETGEYLGASPMSDQVAFPFDEWVYKRTLVDSPLRPSERGVVANAIDALPAFEGTQHRYARVTREGHIWISGRKEPARGQAVEWRVADLDGTNIALVTTPPGFILHDVGTDWVLGVWRDSLDVEFVRLYALVRPVGTGGPGLAQAVARWTGPSPAFERVTGEEAKTASETLKVIAGSQEIFYSENGHYTMSVDSLRRAYSGFRVPESVLFTPLWVEDNGWMYMAVETEADATCFIAYGFVHLMGRMPGEIACWRN